LGLKVIILYDQFDYWPVKTWLRGAKTQILLAGLASGCYRPLKICLHLVEKL